MDTKHIAQTCDLELNEKLVDRSDLLKADTTDIGIVHHPEYVHQALTSATAVALMQH